MNIDMFQSLDIIYVIVAFLFVVIWSFDLYRERYTSTHMGQLKH